MPLTFTHPETEVTRIVDFIRQTFHTQHKTMGVVAVSGGIDSALSLTLLTRALGSKNVIPVMLPYGDQVMDDAYSIVEHTHIPREQWHDINIEPLVKQATAAFMVSDADQVRLGNIQARCRMMAVYDIAKKEDGLVCGTENKSEHFLGYFTRFGDAASDLEPLSHLYKTQVRQLAEFLELPSQLITKEPSAGLWSGQTDEAEMGFTYEVADKVLHQLVDLGKSVDEVIAAKIKGVNPAHQKAVVAQVAMMAFKLQVPYTL